MKPDDVVRTMAGSMVLLSVALTHWVSPWWLVLTAMVGTMLIVAATTGFCPPSRLFNRLGWIDQNGNVNPFTPPEPPLEVPVVDPTTAVDRAQKGEAVLVDVREPDEWVEGVADQAHLLPLSDFQGGQFFWKPFLDSQGKRQICLYCGSGARASRVARSLLKNGYDVVCMGGFSTYRAAGLQTKTAH